MSIKRVYGFISTSDYKIQEFRHLLHYYGIDVVKLEHNVNKSEFFKNTTYKILGIVQEWTYLYKHDTEEKAPLEHGVLVDHVSIVKLYLKDLETKKYECKTEGIIDLTKRSPDGSGIYDWDDVFVVLKCLKSYVELNKLNKKISSRDKNLSELIKDYVHYKNRIDLHYNKQEYQDTIDFTRYFSDYVKTVPQYNDMQQYKNSNFNLYNIITNAINQGTFLRSAKSRREKIYWVPGLNAGLPFVPKIKDSMHEITYQFHDICHFNIPDLVYDGLNSDSDLNDLYKKVYIAYRLVSEAFTLPLGDMVFVKMLKDIL